MSVLNTNAQNLNHRHAYNLIFPRKRKEYLNIFVTPLIITSHGNDLESLPRHYQLQNKLDHPHQEVDDDQDHGVCSDPAHVPVHLRLSPHHLHQHLVVTVIVVDLEDMLSSVRCRRVKIQKIIKSI